jgi:putative membrane protein
MMGFGFVVARFGLFLRELAAVRDVPQQPRLAASMWIGTGLVVLGVAVNLFAAYRHWQTVRRLARGQTIEMRALSPATIVALLLGFVGLLIVFNLVVGVSESN